MDRSNELTLISTTYTADKYGVQQAAETTRKVFCNVQSVTQTEWFDGGRIGLNPELVFSVFSYDYADEEICIYNGTRYRIYRTYLTRDDMIELYAERRQG